MKKLMKLIAPILLSLTCLSSHAESKTAFTEALFKELKSKGEVVLIDVYASWCSTCAKQQGAIASYRKAHPNNTVHVLTVDYDKDKDMVEKLGAPRQSTLILFKGDKQFWYSVAESRPEVIAAELNKAFNFKPKS